MGSNGKLELILGPMFAGKTTELLRRLYVHSDIGFRVLYINNSLDDREKIFSTHNGLYKDRISIDHRKMKKLGDILDQCILNCFDVIGIDEGQFFEDLEERVKFFVEKLNKFVIVSALDGNYKREPFTNVLNLIPLADKYEKFKPYCMECANKKIIKEALFSHRIKEESKEIVIGDKDVYKCLCRDCYSKQNN